MASLLPFRPWPSLDLRVFGFRLSERDLTLPQTASRPFDATSASFIPSLPPVLPFPYRSTSHEPTGTSLELLCPTASTARCALFFAPCGTSKECCPSLWKLRPQGLATLSTILAPPNLGDLFQPPTLLGFALQSFPPHRWSKSNSFDLSPLPHFSPKPISLGPVP